MNLLYFKRAGRPPVLDAKLMPKDKRGRRWVASCGKEGCYGHLGDVIPGGDGVVTTPTIRGDRLTHLSPDVPEEGGWVCEHPNGYRRLPGGDFVNYAGQRV